MHKRINMKSLSIIVLLVLIQSCKKDEIITNDFIKNVTVLEESGGRVSWSYDGEWLAIDQKDTDGYYDVWIMHPDKSDKECLTCDKQDLLPQKHNGSPEFHPSGLYIVFTAEKQDHQGNSDYSRPGQGVFSDIWIMTVDGTQFWKIVDLPNDENYGTVHPHFSPDGTKLSWSEMYEAADILSPKRVTGSWKLKTADFEIINGTPTLTNITEHQPDEKAIYENHGFSKDGQKLLFMSSYEASYFLDNNLYDIDLLTGEIRNLTAVAYKDRNYDEHAQYTPDGTHIIWGTNRDNSNKGMDYWIMNSDGTSPERLTWFNIDEKNTFLPKGKYTTCDFSFDPKSNGKRFVSWIFTDVSEQEGITVLIELK